MSSQDMAVVTSANAAVAGVPTPPSTPVPSAGLPLVGAPAEHGPVSRPWAQHVADVMAANPNFARRLDAGQLSGSRGDNGLVDDILRNALQQIGVEDIDTALDRLGSARDTFVRLLENERLGSDQISALVRVYCQEEHLQAGDVEAMGQVLLHAGMTHDEAKALRKHAADKSSLMASALKMVTCGDIRQNLTAAQERMPELAALNARLGELNVFQCNAVLSTIKRLDKNFQLGQVSVQAHDDQGDRHFLADALELLLPPAVDSGVGPEAYYQSMLERMSRARDLMASLLDKTKEGRPVGVTADQVLTKAAKRSGSRALMMGDVKRRFAGQPGYGERLIWAARADVHNRKQVAEYLMDHRTSVSQAEANDETLLNLSSHATDYRRPASGGGGGVDASCCGGPVCCFWGCGGGSSGDSAALALLVAAIIFIAIILLGLAIYGICAAIAYGVHSSHVNAQIKAMEA